MVVAMQEAWDEAVSVAKRRQRPRARRPRRVAAATRGEETCMNSRFNWRPLLVSFIDGQVGV